MRINSVPSSTAERLGEEYRSRTGKSGGETFVNEARNFMKGMESKDWEQVRSKTAKLSGFEHKHVWEVLVGEGI